MEHRLSHLEPSKRPLSGKTVLVTRSRDQAATLVKLLVEAGAEAVVQPAIQILPPVSWNEIDQIIGQVEKFSAVVFVSTNAVKFFFDRCEELAAKEAFEKSVSRGITLAAIGPGTQTALSARGFAAELLPKESNSESMAEAIFENLQRQRKPATGNSGIPVPPNVLIVRANRGSSVLRERLEANEIGVVEVAAYQSIDQTKLEPNVIERLRKGEIDWVTLTSSAIAISISRLLGTELSHSKFVSISPTTTTASQNAGLKVTAEANEYNMAGLVKAIIDAET